MCIYTLFKHLFSFYTDTSLQILPNNTDFSTTHTELRQHISISQNTKSKKIKPEYMSKQYAIQLGTTEASE